MASRRRRWDDEWDEGHSGKDGKRRIRARRRKPPLRGDESTRASHTGRRYLHRSFLDGKRGGGRKSLNDLDVEDDVVQDDDEALLELLNFDRSAESTKEDLDDFEMDHDQDDWE